MLTQLYFYVMPVFNVDGYRFSWTNVSNGTGIIQKIIHTKKNQVVIKLFNGDSINHFVPCEMEVNYSS